MKKIKSSPSGFTLIELLVVISIIAVLMAIMMPALNRAKEQSYRTVCAARLRDVGKGALLFAADNNDWLPMTEGTTFVDKSVPDGCDECLSIGSSYPHRDYWYKDIANYMSIKNDAYVTAKTWRTAEAAGIEAPKILQCPSMKRTSYGVRGLAYGWNSPGLGEKCKDYHLAANPNSRWWRPVRVSEIKSAAVTGMVGETNAAQDAIIDEQARRITWGGEIEKGTGGRAGFYFYGERHFEGSSYIAVDGHVEFRTISEYIEDWYEYRTSRTGGGIIYPNPRRF